MSKHIKTIELLKTLGVLLGGPTAFAALAEIDDRLELNPILERIVLNFDTFQESAWSDISHFLNLDIDLTKFASLLTITTLLFMPVVIDVVKRGFYGTTDKAERTIFETRLVIIKGVIGLGFMCLLLTMFGLPMLIPLMTFLGALIVKGKQSIPIYKKATTIKSRFCALFTIIIMLTCYIIALPMSVYAALKSVNGGTIPDVDWWVVSSSRPVKTALTINELQSSDKSPFVTYAQWKHH
ncbi:hypothetical protein ACUNV4_14160 [Granulosicoccus sp. 3-233]|uniref:hypothetical protein n=1 Tax=Granulosicoccus sp. 3-233 TaxID=3417969 RepID=UPI003D3326AF